MKPGIWPVAVRSEKPAVSHFLWRGYVFTIGVAASVGAVLWLAVGQPLVSGVCGVCLLALIWSVGID